MEQASTILFAKTINKTKLFFDWSVELVCLVSMAMGFLCSSFLYIFEIVPAPGAVVIVFTVLSFITSCLHLVRRNYLVAISGAYFTVVLGIGCYVTISHSLFPAGPLHTAVLVEPVMTYSLVSLMAATCSFQFIALKWTPGRWDWPEPSLEEIWFARKLVWPSIVLATILVMVTVRGGLITELPYPFNAVDAGIRNAGLEAFGIVLLVYSLLIAVRGYGIRRMAFALLGAIITFDMIFFRLLRGERGSVIGIVLAAAVLFHMSAKIRFKNALMVVIVFLLATCMNIWGHVRWDTAEIGFVQAMKLASADMLRDARALEIGQIQMLPASYWHLLDAVDLYDMGIRRDGATYFNLIGQSVPEAIASWVGYERPLSEPWELAKYRVNGGGFFIIAEGYWNFGIYGAIMVSVVFAIFLTWFERWSRSFEPAMLIGYFTILAFIVAGVGYGTQGLVRVIEVALGWQLILHLLRRFSTRNRLPFSGSLWR